MPQCLHTYMLLKKCSQQKVHICNTNTIAPYQHSVMIVTIKLYFVNHVSRLLGTCFGYYLFLAIDTKMFADCTIRIICTKWNYVLYVVDL